MPQHTLQQKNLCVTFRAIHRGKIISTPTGGSTGNPIQIDLGFEISCSICTKNERDVKSNDINYSPLSEFRSPIGYKIYDVYSFYIGASNMSITYIRNNKFEMHLLINLFLS